jgi:hypothetical protein
MHLHISVIHIKAFGSCVQNQILGSLKNQNMNEFFYGNYPNA